MAQVVVATKGRSERRRSGWCRLEQVWERSFVAVSMLLDGSGGGLEQALAMLPDGAEAERPLLGDLANKLRDPRRAVRAQALATVAQEVVIAVSEVTLR